jgi:hypothetical protein
MDDRFKNRLGSETSQNSVNVDSLIKINVTNNEKTLPVGDINHIVDVGEQFNTERQSSTFYRFATTIRPLMSNSLFNISGPDSWDSFNEPKFRNKTYPPGDNILTDIEDLTYKESINEHLKEINGWFGYNNPNIFEGGLCAFNDMEPKKRRFSFNSDKDNLDKNSEPLRNWEMTLTYPSSSGNTALTNGGLLIFDTIGATVGKRNMTAIGIPVLHNLDIGSIVRLTDTNMDGDYTVKRIGLDNGDLKGYYFVVDIEYNSLVIGPNSRFKQVIGGQESVYYVRYFKKVKTRSKPIIKDNDYEIYPLPFANNIYNDGITQMIVNEDIDVSDLLDNLGRPLSEIYLTVIKTQGKQVDSVFNGFTPINSGIEIPYMPDIQATQGTDSYKIEIPDIRRIHDGGTTPIISHTPLEENVNIISDDFAGDIVEYNKFRVKETVLADVHHRFNTVNRISDFSNVSGKARQEGYYYKAHHKFTIRNYSPYIEQGDISTIGIPYYAEDLGDGRWLWRDLLSIGYNEGQDEPVNYPFLNGSHYLHKNLCFTLKRQDPFGFFGLFSSLDPSGTLNNDNFTTNSAQIVC